MKSAGVMEASHSLVLDELEEGQVFRVMLKLKK